MRCDRPTPLSSAEGKTSAGEGGGGSRRRGRLHRIQPCTGKGARYSCEEEERKCVSSRDMVGTEEKAMNVPLYLGMVFARAPGTKLPYTRLYIVFSQY